MKTPHSYRQQSIHVVILSLLVFIAVLASHCTTTRKAKDPCRYRRGMSGYGYGWIRCIQTKKVCILDPTGKIVDMYYEYPWDEFLFS